MLEMFEFKARNTRNGKELAGAGTQIKTLSLKAKLTFLNTGRPLYGLYTALPLLVGTACRAILLVLQYLAVYCCLLHVLLAC